MSEQNPLIYKDSGGGPKADAVVTIDYYPEAWTCVEYGVDHDVSLSFSTSWNGEAITDAKPWSVRLPYDAIAAGSLSVTVTASTECASSEDPGMSAYIAVSQKGFGAYFIEVPLSRGGSGATSATATVAVNTNSGIVTGLTIVQPQHQ